MRAMCVVRPVPCGGSQLLMLVQVEAAGHHALRGGGGRDAQDVHAPVRSLLSNAEAIDVLTPPVLNGRTC